ncbi:ferrous iron transport protein B [Fodinibius salsisoli]|uniref:Ferrous iron transport protein B n=1 Tax=Fodinibius salsisoli TaxID=2820877 RepID=A0ABT3PRU3_9BACT|nr:ferrous iron transport protein B [Fodinibius salsisoli]MCW9708572.1 ferrous iron transport protein B [Fodinibius salsisoli]
MKNQPLTIALVGNPNTGKSTLFNALTGLKQKVGNYPGVTVERKTGSVEIDGTRHKIIDLPGTYSLNHKKVDERIAYQTLIGEYEYEETPDLAVLVLDSTNLDRNMYLATQVMDLEIPMIVLLNMSDLAEERGIEVDTNTIQKRLGVPVLPIVAKDKGDIQNVRQAIADHDLEAPKPLSWKPQQPLAEAITLITDEWLHPHTDLPDRAHPIEALRLISNNQVSDDFKNHPRREVAEEIIAKAQSQLEDAGENPTAVEVMARYKFIEQCTSNGNGNHRQEESETLSDKIDAVVTHKFLGPVILVAILLLMFQAIFSWAEPFMNLIDLFFVQAGNTVAETLPPGILNDLLVEGIIAGLGGVVIFLPQIMFLFFFISILEGTGYMARAAFVMDGFMTRIGLHGRSVVPLMSGFACAVPGIMAARTIESWSDRLITIMVLPFMACSARLPVYALMISAFVPNENAFGFISMQGLTFFGLYIFGIVMAILAAWVMKMFFTDGESTPFMMELPSYKMPKWSAVFYNMFERGWIFVKEAGKIIMAISIVLWFLASYPKVEVPDSITNSTTTTEASFNAQESASSYKLKHSYAGQIGQFIEPVIKPLGFDWKIGIGLITSFAAREVMVGTLNTIYSVGESGGNTTTLKQKLINDKDPDTGEAVFSTLSAISLMVFFALAMQCMSTLAIVRRETNSWKWPAIMFIYMTALAYICSLVVYQGGQALGW